MSGITRRGSFLLGVVAATSMSLPPASLALDSDAIAACHQNILKGQAAVSRGRIAIVGRCLKQLSYEGCLENDNHGIAHENELRNFVAGDASPCQAALDAGSSVADFGPATCSDEWEDCDVEVPAITTLDDLAECLICQERGYDFFFRDTIGLPRPTPSDLDERRCNRRIARLVSNSVRKNIYDTASCARHQAEPFVCPPDLSVLSRFGKALTTFPRNIAACNLDEGEAPAILTELCDGMATDEATLTTCFEGIAICMACRRANAALGQSEDCTALSGYAGCDGMF